jgi:hypothetical protein
MAKKKQRAPAPAPSAPEYADDVPDDVRADLAREELQRAPVGLHVAPEFIPEDALADEDAAERAPLDDEAAAGSVSEQPAE